MRPFPALARPVFDLMQLVPAHFDALVGSPLPLLDSEFVFTVQAVTRLSSPSPRGEPFTLTVLAPAGTRGAQGTYTLLHPQLGPLPMFLVPVAIIDGRSCFEAVFN